MGVTRIVPVECDRSERRIIKYDRELRVITSAVKQSLKAYHPALDDMTPLRRLIAAPFEGSKFIAHCEENASERLYLASEHTQKRKYFDFDRSRGRFFTRRD